ncbi:MAG: Ig-like domain-containing protein [Lachnospiraceae bacterium]|nr:Ig-like domain-containing protein [Lachnospiraceae bacterium]
MMKRKRLLAFLLAFCMCISQIVTVSATDAETVIQEEVTVQSESTGTEDANAAETTGTEETTAAEATETVDAAEETVGETTTETAGETTDDTAAEEATTVENVEETTTEAEATESVSVSATAETTVTESAATVSTTEETSVATTSLTAVDTSAQYYEDFEGDDASDLWGLTGTLVDQSKLILATSEDGNSYITLTGDTQSQRTATKIFDDMPALSSATFTYNIYPVNQTTDSWVGRPGIQLMSGDIEIVSVYTGEMRGATTTSVYYSVYGSDITDTGVTINAGEWSTITINIDYESYTAEIGVNDETVATVNINEAVTALDSFVINMTSTNGLGSGKTYVAEIRYDNFSFSYEESAVQTGSDAENFEEENASDLWGLTGNLVDEGKLILATSNGNSYITLTGDTQSQRSATKAFEDVPALSTATFSYDIYPVNQTTDSWVGRPGVKLMSGDVEIVSVYTGEMRGASTTSVYYSVYDSDITDTGVTINAGEWSNITINVDFETYTAEILINGESVVTVSINEAVTTLDSFVISMDSTNGLGSGKTYVAEIGYDNFAFSWVGTTAAAKVTVASVEEMADVTVTKTEWENGYAHPDTVTVTLSDNTTATLGVINWTSDAEMDLDDLGTYVWTGELVIEDGSDITNPLGLTVSYTMNYMADFVDSDIYSLGDLDTVTLTLEMWESGYEHPTEVEATLVDGSTITVEIDTDSWSCEDFDESDPEGNEIGAYTWTADIIATEENANPKSLQATYIINWYGNYVSEHDYENEFTFGIWETVAFGKDISSYSGTGYFTLTQEEDDDGNLYMLATVSGNGDRGNRLELNSGIIKSASVQFDWMPVSANTNAYGGQILFMAPDSKNSYFSLIFDSDLELYYYTKCALPDTSTTQAEFDGSISYDDRVDTGLSGDGSTWFTINIEFDYINHTADLTITNKSTGAFYTMNDIPIDTEANGLDIFLIHMFKKSSGSSVTMALDNMYIDYEQFDGGDIVSVTNPDDVSVASAAFDDYEWPTEVEVTLGDGTTTTVEVGEWVCEDFDPDGGYHVYTWTAELITGDYTNYFNLSASFNMTYTDNPYVTYAPNPNTLELEYGTAWDTDQLPTSVTAYLSNGETYELPVSGWVAIRAFNPEEEGIYVYGVNLEGVEGEVDVIDELLTSNEYHVAGDDADLYVYDVYYRISYYDTEDSYYDTYTYSAELLDRGVYAVQSESGEGILVSWRLLVDEYGTDIEFYVYRNGELITEEPITDVTNYLDTEGSVGDVYTIKTVQDGYYWISDAYVATAENYLSITLQNPGPQQDVDGNWVNYTINDCGTADVDGDGELEIIVKWYPEDAFDSGKQNGPSAPTIFDVYEMDGTALWRLNMGLDCPSGAHWNQFMLYDLDEDGCAELFIKTSDGTTSYKPNEDGLFDMTDESTIISVMGDASVAGTHILSTGHVSADANEWITVYDGATGELICYTDYIYETTDPSDYGDNWYNRASRYNIAIAYQPVDRTNESAGTIPTVLFNHGYYAKTTVAAYTLRTAADGSKYLQLEWGFDSSDYPDEAYTGKGNHNVATGDVDNDGFDELVIGAMCIDHDGNVLWVKDGSDGQDVGGHSDALSLAAMNPDDPTQLYVFTPMEEVGDATLSGNLSNAGTGSRINGMWYGSDDDIGRGLAANITPTPGYEYWCSIPENEGVLSGGIYNFTTGLLTNSRPSNMKTNFIVYWDGDLLSELLDSDSTEGPATVYKYDWVDNELDTLQIMDGTKLNNSTKNNPSLTADLLGDWREEIVVRGEDNETLYIYMTNYETDYAIYSLMYDPVYRNAVANQNTSYNQPPHLGFYLGEDNADQVLSMSLPTANISYTTVKAAGTSVAEAEEEYWADVIEQIEAAEEGSTITLDIDPSVTDTMPSSVMDALANNSTVSLVLNYYSDGVYYTVTIPAGEAISDDSDSYTLEELYEYYKETSETTEPEASDDSSDSSSLSGSDYWDAIDDIIAEIEADQAIGGGVVIIDPALGLSSLPNSIMQALVNNPDVMLMLEYDYAGTHYTIVIPAGTAVDDDTEWYGPLWLYENYGFYNLDGTSSKDTSTTASSTSSAPTGDAAGNTVLYCVIIMAVAALGAGVLIVYRRRKRFQA